MHQPVSLTATCTSFCSHVKPYHHIRQYILVIHVSSISDCCVCSCDLCNSRVGLCDFYLSLPEAFTTTAGVSLVQRTLFITSAPSLYFFVYYTGVFSPLRTRLVAASGLPHFAVGAVNVPMIRLPASESSSPFHCPAILTAICSACSQYYCLTASKSDVHLFPLASLDYAVDVPHCRLNLLGSKGRVAVHRGLTSPQLSGYAWITVGGAVDVANR